MANMQWSGSSGDYEQKTELFMSQVLAGRPEAVKPRLIDAMESIGYHIIEDEPNIIGRRDSKGWGKWYSSADVLDYASSLTVRFRSAGEGSTRVTFDYLIRHAWLNDGEKNIVAQEAKTLAALSRVQAIDKLCSVCETDSTDDSRFCRNCGAPLTSESIELEVLRLMAETRAAKTSVVTSALLTMLLTVFMPLVALLAVFDLMSPRKLMLLLGGGVLLMFFTLICNLFGWNRLKRALRIPETSQKTTYRKQTLDIKSPEERVSVPQGIPFASITEGTTNLLDPEDISAGQHEKIPVHRSRITRDLE